MSTPPRPSTPRAANLPHYRPSRELAGGLGCEYLGLPWAEGVGRSARK